ncbi:MAG: glyceraldehyde-3-phosphate dehydrogenase [Lentimicrobiaceae bacterium]|nr:glyceraldehyde-3-phosphate dehydrogenase [Lentimicrobiaceae bacterium]
MKEASNHAFEQHLHKWIQDEKAANEFIDVIGKLWFDKSIELILFRRQLLDRGASSILHKHSYAENIIQAPLCIQDSLGLAKAMLNMDIAPARIDIGRLGREWLAEKEKYSSYTDFLSDKLQAFIGAAPRSTRTQDVVLYGFGRIGRLLARSLITQAGNGSRLRIRAIVTRSNSETDIRKRASLLRKDSVHGHFNGIAVENIEDKTLYVNGHVIHMIAANNPEDVDYEAYGIKDALVIDNTGIARDREGLSRHLKAKGVQRVLLTAPGKGDIPNIVYGVNQETCDLDPAKEQIFSAASCTTNAVVPVLQVIENKLGIVRGHIETIHSYTNDQNLLDNFHKKYRRGRSAALNMVITETGADKAAVKAIPSLKGKLTANSVRVPTPNVSLAILSLTVPRDTSVEEVNALMQEASLKGTLIEQIRYSTSSELVSTDCIGDSCACIYDSPATKVSDDKRNIVLYAWYDNEFGYTQQVIRLAKHISQVKSYRYY